MGGNAQFTDFPPFALQCIQKNKPSHLENNNANLVYILARESHFENFVNNLRARTQNGGKSKQRFGRLFRDFF